tara:strand:+ start:470 stop:778 length:309 start_codon:yes stop_codon:yes gene_type:complete
MMIIYENHQKTLRADNFSVYGIKQISQKNTKSCLLFTIAFAEHYGALRLFVAFALGRCLCFDALLLPKGPQGRRLYLRLQCLQCLCLHVPELAQNKNTERTT